MMESKMARQAKYTRSRRYQESLNLDEYKLICFLRNRRRRAVGQSVCFSVTLDKNGLKCEPIHTTGASATSIDN